ncbi:unnamed protein product [Aureobasidium vineae]|uniref:Isochorismatase-like domain-containing protein n=1 Tax=Aureobasidium vineae TaxID=2773715 RepID=A0A9N8JXK8_9PEZI|nr:unnamed protein product [Aureobasidium vineae]
MELPNAIPYAFRFRPESTALVIVDMQRDFLEPGGFGSIQCGDDEVFKRVRGIVPVVQRVLEASRELGLYVMHTREGHLPDLSDLPASKRLRQTTAPNGHHTIGIGEPGPMGRLLVRGEYGHDIIDELRPLPDEVVIDKPGKGSFWKTGFHRALLNRGITHLLLAGVTTECCVNTTAREAADRGFECCILNDCTSGFDANLVTSANDTICAYDGLFGYVGASRDLIELCESQSLPGPSDAAMAQEDLSLMILARAYREGTTTPVDIARIVAGRTLEYHRQSPNAVVDSKALETLLHEAETLEQEFSSKPWPLLYGIPFATSRDIEDPTVEALISAGALYIRSLPEPLVSVAARMVSFALDSNPSSIARARVSHRVVVFQPTLIDDRPAINQDSESTAIVAQSVEEARQVWLALEQHLDRLQNTSAISQTLTNSWVWHVDFRGPRNGGFVFGIPSISRANSCCSDALQHNIQAAKWLQAAGGQAQEIDWNIFEQAEEVARDLSSLAAAETVSMKAVLNLQTRQTKLSRRATKILESIDVLLISMTACLCHTASQRAEQSRYLFDGMAVCSVSVNTKPTQTQEKEDNGATLMLVGATGRDGRILDIAWDLEKTMLH